ncbi:protein serine/threonine kinase, putative [Entamoeba invadens IP1]|uniref:Protein serine/threonine kinase, putative n=1 Tax=Entamoeba invadens IP1 TaxID=370355 RepID=A0A0A1U1L4_ENTIV|nr:protein serine/threonine kinase, putative [Entamoeba invadens IP1]ELP84917.1 protein serine/threonine kinase, putative [Entamoeba invadens IP1]|eukprot:XP_004184263.1 protein serine/threonine kinase, putative [Entamoeba invadens IP1]
MMELIINSENVQTSLYETNKIKTNYLNEVESNVLYFDGLKYIVVRDDFLVVINSKNLEEILLSNFNKRVVIASVNGFNINENYCMMGQVENNIFICLEYLRCPFGFRNSTSKTCERCPDQNCIYCEDTTQKCIQCQPNFMNKNGTCMIDYSCKASNGNDCYKCIDGKEKRDMKCVEPTEHCQSWGNTSFCEFCNPQERVINKDGKCEDVSKNIVTYSNDRVLSCDKNNFVKDNLCQKCSMFYENSMYCEFNKITKCDIEFLIIENQLCSKSSCSNSENSHKDTNGLCFPSISNCDLTVNNKCVLCETQFVLTTNNTCVFYNDSSCQFQDTLGCHRCVSGSFSDSFNTCQTCDDNCLTCLFNSTFCLTCKNGYFVNDFKCVPNKELEETCKKFSVTGSGCYRCKIGFYRVGLNCYKCQEKCSTCVNGETCTECNITNYKTSDGDCLPQNSIFGCASPITQNGCSMCQQGFYKYKENQCQKCNEKCSTCTSLDVCNICIEDYILIGGMCIHYSSLDNCLSSTFSKCSKCAFWHKPSVDGTFCDLSPVWWVILLIILFILFVLIILATTIGIIFKKILKKLRKKEVEKKCTIFKMNKSNIEFIALKGGVCVNNKEIEFIADECNLPILTESRELICVGNLTERTLKIQFSTKTQGEKFSVRFNPEIVTLKKGYASEFELFVKPYFTCVFEENILIISKSLKTGEEVYNEITVKGETVLSTRLDPDELRNEKKLGEGGFGVVYKGKYRGNVVAIKRMKNFEDINSKMEFMKEVEMLDKFRSEYIVHFYGAVFVALKKCMVTEFAKYGSLQDLIIKNRNNEISKGIRLKICLNAAKGIFYLHENGILHRDVKPDNILVFSLDINENVIAKLTDFGSSRNINMLMTNMTFTKGIGTPVYMAPEVLKRGKYKKPADIFSFAITMYECLGWCTAYPPQRFKFSWNIADFVTEGKRLEKPNEIDMELFIIIKEAWEQNPKDRIEISQIVNLLENYTQI